MMVQGRLRQAEGGGEAVWQVPHNVQRGAASPPFATRETLSERDLIRGSLEPTRSDGKRVSNEAPIRRQQLQTLFLGLNQQQFVKRISMVERLFQSACGMPHRQRQKRDLLIFQRPDHILGRKAALAVTRHMPGTVFQTHLPNRHGTNVQSGSAIGQ